MGKPMKSRRIHAVLALMAGMKQKKILGVCLLIIVSTLLLFVRHYFEKTSAMMKDEVADSMLQAVRQVESNIAYRLSKVKETSDSLVKNIELYERLGRLPEDDTVQVQIADAVQLTNTIQSLESRNEVWKIRLFVEERKLYASDNLTFYNLRTIEGQAWFKQAVEKLGASVWLPTQRIHYLNATESVRVIPLVRTIKHPENFSHIIGLLSVDMPERLVSSVLESVKFEGVDIAIYDRNGTIVSHPNSEFIGKSMDAGRWGRISSLEEGIVEDAAGGEYMIFRVLEGTDWKIAARIPSAKISAGNERYATISTLVIVISCLILFIMVVIFIFAAITESTVRKIRNMTVMIKKEGIDAEIGQTDNGSGSIISLESNVNRLIGTIKHLTVEAYSANAREREAQLRALQAQINPHFLYNTLDTINWMAIRRDADEISTIVNSLAQYFRLSLSKGKDIVTVADEINLAKSYLEIQKHRFHEMFEYEIEVQPELLIRKIPKLSLQPIIENALLHGIQQLEGARGQLRIEGCLTDSGYRLAVIDNGVGMDGTTLAMLSNMDMQEERQSYGLFNVKERIELYFGSTSDVVIESRLHEGTRVEIRVTEDR